MAWTLDNDRPIYQQIIEHIEREIISGKYKAGEKLPSVRDLAMQAAVNPNTMQKALSELERSGLVYAQRTSGRFITEDENMIKELKTNQATQHIQHFLTTMKQLGFAEPEILTLIQHSIKEAVQTLDAKKCQVLTAKEATS